MQCGDSITVSVEVENGVIKRARFDGHGCALSLATADLLCEHLEGKPLEALRGLTYELAVELLGFVPSVGRAGCVGTAVDAFKSLRSNITDGGR